MKSFWSLSANIKEGEYHELSIDTGTHGMSGIDFLPYKKYNEHQCGGSSMTRMGRPRKDNAKRKSITVRMPEDTHNKLMEYAAKHEMSMTEVTLRSLEEFLSKQR